MTSLSFVVPGVPRGKGRPRFSRATGHAYTPETTRSYESMVRGFAMDAMKLAGIERPIEGPVMVTIAAWFPIPKSFSKRERVAAETFAKRPGRPDIDQVQKSALDGMNGVVFVDDGQVAYIRASKCYGAVPRLQIDVDTL